MLDSIFKNMNFFKKNNNQKEENRLRLQNLVDQTKTSDVPAGWQKKTFLVGGLSEVGFSKKHPELLLIISSQGRGVIDCSKLELIERDYDTSWEWIDSCELWAMGIGKLLGEKIIVGGLHGGGLPASTKEGNYIQFMATNWPIIDLIFEPNFKSVYKEDQAKDCFRIFHDYELRAYGFSFDGNYFIIATSSEVNVYRKQKSNL